MIITIYKNWKKSTKWTKETEKKIKKREKKTSTRLKLENKRQVIRISRGGVRNENCDQKRKISSDC